MIDSEQKYGSYEFFEPPFEECQKAFFHSNTLLERFKEKILFPLQEYEGNNPYLLKRPLGLLLFSAPGQGKTFMAKSFAQMLNRPYIIVNRHRLLRDENKVLSCSFACLIEMAAKLSATIVLENVETILPNRDTVKNDSSRLDVANILDLIKQGYERNILFIATTSRPQDTDAQIGYSGYLNELFYLPFPDEAMRSFIFQQSLKGRPVEKIDYNQIVEASENFTVANILNVVDNAALQSALSKCLISTKCVLDFIKKNDEKEAKSFRDKYDNMARQLDVLNGDKRKTIGFT